MSRVLTECLTTCCRGGSGSGSGGSDSCGSGAGVGEGWGVGILERQTPETCSGLVINRLEVCPASGRAYGDYDSGDEWGAGSGRGTGDGNGFLVLTEFAGHG